MQVLNMFIISIFIVEITLWNCFHAMCYCKLFSTLPNQKHVWGMLHHSNSSINGVSDIRQSSDCSSLNIFTIHDRRIQLMGSSRGEDRALSSVEMSRVFQDVDGNLNCLNTRTAICQVFIAFLK